MYSFVHEITDGSTVDYDSYLSKDDLKVPSYLLLLPSLDTGCIVFNILVIDGVKRKCPKPWYSPQNVNLSVGPNALS